MAMEHRWGRRIPVDTNITLRCRRVGRCRGRLRNISSGGVFVQTSLSLPMYARVELVLAGGIEGATRIHRFEAVVSRLGQGGIGLMFVQFNPHELTALLARLGAGETPALRALPSPRNDARRRQRSETK